MNFIYSNNRKNNNKIYNPDPRKRKRRKENGKSDVINYVRKRETKKGKLGKTEVRRGFI